MTNAEIKKYTNKEGDDLKKKLVGVFSSDYVNKFMQCDVLMKQKQSPYPFIIMNTETAVEEGEHWWSFLYLDPPK